MRPVEIVDMLGELFLDSFGQWWRINPETGWVPVDVAGVS